MSSIALKVESDASEEEDLERSANEPSIIITSSKGAKMNLV